MGPSARPPLSIFVARQLPNVRRPKPFASEVPFPWPTHTGPFPETPVCVSPAAHRPPTLSTPRCPSACPSPPPFGPFPPSAAHRPARPPASLSVSSARLLASNLPPVCYSSARGGIPQEATAWAALSGKCPLDTPGAKPVETSVSHMMTFFFLTFIDAPGTALGVGVVCTFFGPTAPGVSVGLRPFPASCPLRALWCTVRRLLCGPVLIIGPWPIRPRWRISHVTRSVPVAVYQRASCAGTPFPPRLAATCMGAAAPQDMAAGPPWVPG